MSDNNPTTETSPNRIPTDRVRFGLFVSILGMIIFSIGAKPEWFGLDRSPVIGFVQISVFLIGLAVMCLGGYIGLAALWGNEEKTIAADIGLRLIGTGYVLAVFTGMADVFGMSVIDTPQVPFFGPWQAAGVEIGMAVIAIGILMMIPFHQFQKKRA